MNIIKALRLAFLPASLLPYILGAVYIMQKSNVDVIRVIFGAVIVAATHLSANLINDYADSRSGADWQDLREYLFFGGSKLIQKGILHEQWYKKTALAGYSFVILLLAIFTIIYGPWYIFFIGAFVVLLSASYSLPPLKLSYYGFGELTVMLLFGPVTICGGANLSTGFFPNSELIILSLPVAFWIGAVLLCNGIADFKTDKLIGKRTIAVRIGIKKANLLYLFFIFFAAIFTVGLNIQFKVIIVALEVCLGVVGYFFIRSYNNNPEKMKIPAKITIAGHALTITYLILFLR